MQSNQIHGIRSESIGPRLRLLGANVPEGFIRGTVTSQVRAAAAFPHSIPLANVNIGEQIRIGVAFVMVEANIHPLAIRGNIPRAMAHGDIVNKGCAKIELGEEIVIVGHVDSVMARAVILRIDSPLRFINDTLDRAEPPSGEDTAIRVHHADVSYPAVRDSGQGYGIISPFSEMPLVGRVGEHKSDVFDARLCYGRIEFQDLRLPLLFDIKA